MDKFLIKYKNNKFFVKSSDGLKFENYRYNICYYVDGNVYIVEVCENEYNIVLKYLLYFKMCFK